MDNQVTEVKNEGRVAAGKRLVEWNRKNKANLKSGDPPPDSSCDQVPPQVSSSCVWYGGLGVIILAGGAVYLYTRHTTPTTPSTLVKPSLPDNDIF